MKKSVKFFAIAAAVFAFAACNNTPAQEEVIDTLPAEEIVEETIDTLAGAVEAVAEEVAAEVAE